jgi:hypothetical protein
LRGGFRRDSLCPVSGRRAIRCGRRSGGREKDLFRARLDQIIDMGHPLAKLARTIDWRFLEDRFGAFIRTRRAIRR